MIETWPPGVRFLPMDDILITHYLSNKIQGKPLPLEGAILEADVYGQHAGPWQFFQNPDEYWQTRVDCSGKLITNESVRYVFTRLIKVGKGTGNKQRSRAAGGGCWHGNNSEDVLDKDGNKVGYKKTFKFKGGNNVTVPSDLAYIMHEYSTLWCDEFVVCKIKLVRREKRRQAMSSVDELEKRSRSDHQSNHVYPMIQEQNVQQSHKPDQAYSNVHELGSSVQPERLIDHPENYLNDEDQLLEDELKTYLTDESNPDCSNVPESDNLIQLKSTVDRQEDCVTDETQKLEDELQCFLMNTCYL